MLVLTIQKIQNNLFSKSESKLVIMVFVRKCKKKLKEFRNPRKIKSQSEITGM